MPKKKFLYCTFACAARKWHDHKAGYAYCCRGCGHVLSSIAAGSAEKARRRAVRAEKGSCTPDTAYMQWVAQMPCLRCLAAPPSHAHHTVHRSQGGGDRSCVPLCVFCHAVYHDQLGSIRAAKAHWGLDLAAAAERLSAEFDAANSPG